MKYTWGNRAEYSESQAREILAKLSDLNSAEERVKEIALAIRETIVEVAIEEREKQRDLKWGSGKE